MGDKPLTVWFAGGVTEAHRTEDAGALLSAALAEEGVWCVSEPSEKCDLFFCAAFTPYHLPRVVREAEAAFPGVPVVHYCWDLYPFQVERDHEHRGLWTEYVADLKRATGVVVPSRCTVDRVRQYCGADVPVSVVLTSVRPWDPPRDMTRRTPIKYVYNTMRNYPTEPNVHLLREVCTETKRLVPMEPGGALDWGGFRNRVLNAECLVSPYYEASTGGLTLLEGYYHGLPLVLADSPRNGVADYFPDGREGAFWFDWDSRLEFRRALDEAVRYGRVAGDLLEARRLWVRTRYSEAAMARGLARAFRTAVHRRRSDAT